jgi:hypothetical protein
MPAACGLGKNSRRFGSAVGIGVTGPNLIRLADRPCRAADRLYEAPSHLKREGRAFGGGGTAHPDLGKARGDAFRRRSIGILAAAAQGWRDPGSKCSRSPATKYLSDDCVLKPSR